jgi:hypothetical protein
MVGPHISQARDIYSLTCDYSQLTDCKIISYVDSSIQIKLINKNDKNDKN